MRATIIGAGGLGGPIALSLGAAGVELTIVDPNVVDVSALPRLIHAMPADVGKANASLLAGTVVARGGRARAEQTRWITDNADSLSDDADVVVDASCDPATSVAVTEWAVAKGRCHVIASAYQFGGGVFAGAPGTACFRCMLGEAVDSQGHGVLGPVVGAIGGVAGALAIGLARGDRSHAGTLFAFEDLRRSSEPRIVHFDPRAGCTACARAAIAPGKDHVRVAGGRHA